MRSEEADGEAPPRRGLRLAESPNETSQGRQTSKGRSRGRPRKVIDREELIDAVEQLFREGGLDAVSIDRAAQETPS